jgi:hypothetical protein
MRLTISYRVCLRMWIQKTVVFHTDTKIPVIYILNSDTIGVSGLTLQIALCSRLDSSWLLSSITTRNPAVKQW